MRNSMVRRVPLRADAIQADPIQRKEAVRSVGSPAGFIEEAAKKHGLDPVLLKAVGMQESGLGSMLQDGRGDGGHGYGWFQLDDRSHPKELLQHVQHDPAFAADYAAGMLSASLKRHNGDWSQALAEYNSGQSNPKYTTYTQWGKERLNYSDSVMRRVSDLGGRVDHRVGMSRKVLRADPSPGVLRADPSPKPTASPIDNTNPMDIAGSPPGDTSPGLLQTPSVQSALSTMAGHQDLMFILQNANLRDGDKIGIAAALQAKGDNAVKTAFQLWKKNPGQAMDEYGLGSPIQADFMRKHFPNTPDGRLADAQMHHPRLNAIATAAIEQVNPMSWLEGGAIAKGLKVLSGTRIGSHIAEGLRSTKAGEKATSTLGSPLANIHARAGNEGEMGVTALIARVKKESRLSDDAVQQIFGNLTPEEKWEVVRLKQGLKPNPKFFKQYVELEKRAKLLHADTEHVTNEQLRTGVLDKHQVYNRKTFFPMSNSYDFGPQWELEQELAGHATGGSGSAARHKSFDNFDEAVRSGHLDPTVDPADNYYNFRRQRMERVAFEDSVQDLPKSLRRDVQGSDFNIPDPWVSKAGQTQFEALSQHIAENHAKYPSGHPQRIELAENPKYVAAMNLAAKSPALKKSMVAPELYQFFSENGAFRKFIDSKGSYLPGNAGGPMQHFVGAFRASVLANFVWHPVINVAQNDAAGRTLFGLRGARAEAGGMLTNTVRAIARQAKFDVAAKKIAEKAGVNPDNFLEGAQEYRARVDRALRAGAEVEFGRGKQSALGGNRAQVVTTRDDQKLLTRLRDLFVKEDSQAADALRQRIDKWLTKSGDLNMDRTFGERGEQRFAVDFFHDALKDGYSEADAAKMTRMTMTNYYAIDPKNPASGFFFFMPFFKGNTKLWTNMLLKRPQVALAPAHAIRNLNIQRQDPALQGHFAANDFSMFTGTGDEGQRNAWTFPTPMNIAPHIANAAGSAAKGDVMGVMEQGDQVLEGRAMPQTKLIADGLHTAYAGFDKEMHGPETDFNIIVNPKAPPSAQMTQAIQYVVGNGLPVPLFGFAFRDAMRRGIDPKQAVPAALSAVGIGYPSERLGDDQKRAVKVAQKIYLTRYYQYLSSERTKDDHDQWIGAWDDYMKSLNDAGVIHTKQ